VTTAVPIKDQFVKDGNIKSDGCYQPASTVRVPIKLMPNAEQEHKGLVSTGQHGGTGNQFLKRQTQDQVKNGEFVLL